MEEEARDASSLTASRPTGAASQPPPPCPPFAVTNVAQGMVFSTWGFMFIAGIGIAVVRAVCGACRAIWLLLEACRSA